MEPRLARRQDSAVYVPITSSIVRSEIIRLVYVCRQKIDQSYGQWKEKDSIIENQDTAG